MQSFRIVLIPLLALAVSLAPARSAAQLVPLLPHIATPEPGGDPQENSVEANSLQGRVAALLLRGDYDQIDRLATKYRSEKTRLPGGGWKLSHLYEGLNAPDRFRPEDHIARLNVWIAARPQSITPRVALAGVYLKYAWAARGSGWADSVTPEGWRLFAERAAQAKHVLDDAANLKPMCPEWFSKMQNVALAQHWDNDRAAALYAHAAKFEPDYIYFYKSYALYLLPKWEGRQGDVAAFAKKSADTLGGEKGDFIYFQISMVVLGDESGKDGAGFDWARVQSGYEAQRDLYERNTNFDTNHLALAAWRFHDRTIAQQAFAQIGDKWSKDVWKTRARFDKVRAWAGA